MIAVADTSPLILLAKTGHLDLLQSLFSEVVIPEAVHREISVGGSRAGANELAEAQWISVRSVQDRSEMANLLRFLHDGEAEAILLAAEVIGPVVLLVDDAAARREARHRGLLVHGTAGLIVQAKERALIPKVRPVLDQLIAVGLYLDETLYERLLETVQEEIPS